MTPLVDVVLVLLIIFMVVTPRLEIGPAVDVPDTRRPPALRDDTRRIIVAVEARGSLWIDGEPVPPEELVSRLRERSRRDGRQQVVIEGDAGLTFGEVKAAITAVDLAGLPGVGLTAEAGDGS